MAKVFNVNGACRPGRHYMVDLTFRLKEIKKMIDDGQYFAINKARQYGKTTTLRALTKYLEKDYNVVNLDFQRMSSSSFVSEESFVSAFSEELLDFVKEFPDDIERKLLDFAEEAVKLTLPALFKVLKLWCKKSPKPIVLIIDEADTATNNQVFLDFLAQLRAAYLDSDITPTFQSVILASVYDIRNIKRKIRSDGEQLFGQVYTDCEAERQLLEHRIKEIFSREYQSGNAAAALRAMKNPRKAGRRRKHGPEAQEQIQAVSVQGKSIREISAETGIPKSTVQRLKKDV